MKEDTTASVRIRGYSVVAQAWGSGLPAKTPGTVGRLGGECPGLTDRGSLSRPWNIWILEDLFLRNGNRDTAIGESTCKLETLDAHMHLGLRNKAKDVMGFCAISTTDTRIGGC